MGWSTHIDYYRVAERSDVTFGSESKTETYFTYEAEPNPEPGELTSYVRVPHEVDYDRTVKTTRTETVYECRGVQEGIAAGAVRSSGEYDSVTGDYAQTVVEAERCNDAGGWMVRKTVTEVKVKRGFWRRHTEA